MRTNTDAVNIYRLQKAIQTVEVDPNHSADAIRDIMTREAPQKPDDAAVL